jgi:hypothetical protein
MINKKNKYDIEFISDTEGLSTIKDANPGPSKDFIPKWWKEVQLTRSNISFQEVGAGNVKNCPSFPDYFSSGYIIPAWSDMLLSFDPITELAKSEISNPEFTVTIHGNNQYLDNVNHVFLGQKSYVVFKLICPWKIVTKPGYSVYQLPTIYHFNEDFSVLPGVIDTDIHHNANLQLIIHTNKKDIFIPRGTPLAQFIPFKRKTTKFDVRDANYEDSKMFKNLELKYTTKFVGSKVYQKLRKERDSK